MLGAAIVLPLYRLDKMYPPLTADLQEQEKPRLIRIESIRLPQRKTADSPAYDWRTT